MKFFDALDNIQDMSYTNNYFVWAKLDNDDPDKEEYKSYIGDYPELTVKWGLSKGKVDAVNRDLDDLPECDILIIMSDDIKFESFGFDDDIRDAFRKYFPDLDGTIHFPDDHGGQKTIIVSMVGINLYKKLGYLYHPDYESVYCDDDFTNLTKKTGKYKFVNKRLFSHNHPIWTKTGWDDQYKHNERPEVYKRDHIVFERRKATNYGL
jgi:hypothetical protein